jgi:hypothetical protein
MTVRFIHFLTSSFMIFYLLIFNKRYDVLYLVVIGIISLHWYFMRGECALSYLEKRAMDPTYKLGQDVYSHPYLDKLFGKTVTFFHNLMLVCTASFVVYRAVGKYHHWVMFFVVPYLLYNIYVISKRLWVSDK